MLITLWDDTARAPGYPAQPQTKPEGIDMAVNYFWDETAMADSATRLTSLSMSTASSTSAVVTATAMTASGQILSGHGICLDGCPGSSAMRRFQRTGGMQSGRHAGHA